MNVAPINRPAAPIPPCRSCDGTGKWKLLRSWFPADGYHTEACSICRGTGVSRHPDIFSGWRYDKALAQSRCIAAGA